MKVTGTIVTAFVAMMSAASVSNASLVAYYTFDGNLLDSSGNGHNGTATATGTSYVTGEQGSALAFDGVSGSVTAPYSSAISLAGTSYTVAFWANVAEVKEQAPVSIFDDQASLNGGSSILFRNDGSYQSLYNDNNGETQKFDTTKVNIGSNVNVWTQYTLVYDQVAHTRSLYVNGVLKDTLATPTDVIDPGSGTMHIGSLFNGDIGNFFYYHGALDELRLYNEALSSNAVAALVPEPSSMAMLGLMAFGMHRRRRPIR